MTTYQKWLKDSLKLPVRFPPPSYFILTLVSITSIALYGKYRCKYLNTYTDFLEGELFKGSNKLGLDGWSLTHYFGYAFMGFIFPNMLIFTTIGGILWELFETYVGIYKPSIIMDIGFCKSLNSDGKNKVWWYGKLSDIVVNTLGVLSGAALNQHLNYNFKPLLN